MNHLLLITGYIPYNSGWLLMIAVAVVSFFVQMRFRSKFKQYSEIGLLSGLSGKEVAEKMLLDNQIYDVQVISVEGQLTDHYNPENKTVNLSPDVYHSRSVASAAIAAHECGHAVQHAKAYSWLSFRSAMVPIVNTASTLTTWTLMIGMLLLFFSGSPYVLAIGVVALGVVTTFSFITLPVEFDASNRALLWLSNNYSVMRTDAEQEQAKDALWWAAMTYVVAALGSLATLLYYASFLFNRRN
ncbi:zinc metallopeptidase [Mucilaginibacter paludis]|uniref:Peptidase membrane zinc metallopeptidase n=1 Tax=Mucilaginibacter paludis DSM 18603 TaxID=714943 RepID=H1YIT0_9SPHI|nr:zinc metallopeptidase [Mucilaginibacter paludis]EHQ27625.1 peptidase membrane zinc metallopeptidase [Mucilaginibacter paludis DSM 18603]